MGRDAEVTVFGKVALNFESQRGEHTLLHGQGIDCLLPEQFCVGARQSYEARDSFCPILPETPHVTVKSSSPFLDQAECDLGEASLLKVSLVSVFW